MLFARIYLVINAALTLLAFMVNGHVTTGNLAATSISAAFMAPIAFFPLALLRWKPRESGSGLDQVLFRFPTGDAFYLRHLLTSICIFGIIGSGKSSSSGLFFARLIVRINSGGLILASNPDDAEWWSKRFAEAGRSDDLIVFSKTSKARWNFLAKLQDGGADARELTVFLVVASETLTESKGKEDIFWKSLSERMLFNVISALMLAGERVSAGNIFAFLATAAYTGERLQHPDYLNGFCHKTLEKARKNATDPVNKGDYIILHEYWKSTFVYLDEKPRSSALSAVENITHCLSVGYAREIFSGETTHSTEDIAKGRFLLLDFPVSAGGPTSKLIYSLAKLAVQKAVLKNEWTPDQPVTVVWCDEAWHVCNSGDRDFLAEARKHGGVLIYLAQSILSFEIAMGGGMEGEKKARNFLGMVGSLVAHASDMATGKYFVELMGEQETDEIGGTYTPGKDLIERLGGQSSWTGNFSRRRLPIMTTRQMTAGMRMGGESKVVDAWVYRPELFATGSNMQKMEFFQD